MTNNDFETKHPRGHAKNKGSFSEKTNTAPEGDLTVGTPIMMFTWLINGGDND
jgi:hypothetical protein